MKRNLLLSLSVLLSLPLMLTVYRGLSFQGIQLFRSGASDQAIREHLSSALDTVIGVALFVGMAVLFFAALYFRYPG